MPASEETSSLSRWTRRPTDNSIDDADAVMVVSRPIAVTAEAAGGAQPLRSGPVLRRTTIDQAPTSRSQASASLAGDLSDVDDRRRSVSSRCLPRRLWHAVVLWKWPGIAPSDTPTLSFRYRDKLLIISDYCNCSLPPINPLECKGNYSATSNSMKLVHWPLMDGLFGTARRGLGGAAHSGPSSLY